MKDDNTVFVGLDVHKDTIAIAVAEDGRGEPRFVGTCGPQLRELLKTLARLGERSHTLIAYEAGPSGFALARRTFLIVRLQHDVASAIRAIMRGSAGAEHRDARRADGGCQV